MSEIVTSNQLPSNDRKERVVFLDVLRVLATLAVIFDHVANQHWYAIPSADGSLPFPPHWGVLHFYESLAHWAVPVFVMISGALFLARDVPVKKIWRKYIAHLATAFLFWTILYAIIDYANNVPLEVVISRLFTGPMHFWYLWMIMGLYAVMPMLRLVARNEKLTKYYVGLSLVFCFAAYQIQAILLAFSSPAATTVQTLNGYLGLSFLGIYTSYFLLGHLWVTKKPTRGTKIWLYVAGIAGFVLTTGLSFWQSYYLGRPSNTFFDNVSLNLFLAAIGIFAFARDFFDRLPRWITDTCAKISPFCFGIYLMHPIVIGYLETLGINGVWINPWLAVPALTIFVFVSCLSLTALIRLLPSLGQKIT